MEKACKIIRRSIHTFLQRYQRFTSVALVVFPVSTSILLSQSLLSSSPVFQIVYSRLQSIFLSAGFPPSSPLFSVLCLKLSQTLPSSLFTLPFSLSFLLIAKACVIRTLSGHPLPTSMRLYYPLLLTHVLNCFILFSANSATLSALFLAFNASETLGFSSSNTFLFLSAAGAVFYSIVLANTLAICNLAVIVAGMENCGGYRAILRASVLMRGRAATALSLALPTNLLLAAIETLFQFRVVKSYHFSNRVYSSFVWEASLVAYVYSVMTVLDTVIGCMFYKSCKSADDWALQQRDGIQIEATRENDGVLLRNCKTVLEIP